MTKRQPLRHFLLVFDHSRGELVDTPEEFATVESALDRYSDIERHYDGDSLVEVVLIGSDSLETVRRTHANYFDGTVAISKYLVGL